MALGSVEALLVTARREVVTEVVRCMGQVGAEVPGYGPYVLAAEGWNMPTWADMAPERLPRPLPTQLCSLAIHNLHVSLGL